MRSFFLAQYRCLAVVIERCGHTPRDHCNYASARIYQAAAVKVVFFSFLLAVSMPPWPADGYSDKIKCIAQHQRVCENGGERAAKEAAAGFFVYIFKERKKDACPALRCWSIHLPIICKFITRPRVDAHRCPSSLHINSLFQDGAAGPS